MATTYKFKAYYKKNGVGATQNPAPVCTVINMADDSKLADAQATTASTNMPGLYTYSYTGNDGLDCVAYFHTTDADADEADVASYVSDKITTNLNADVAGVETKVDAILEDTGNTLDALIKDVPTVSEFEARTKPAADYALEATLTAIKGAGWTTESLKVIRDALTAVQADLDNPNQYKADVSALATTTHLQQVEDKVDTIDTIADAIKSKTDNLPAVPAQAGEYTAAIAALQADLDNPDQYKADVSGIPAAVWGYATRTLSSFGTLISDIWAHATRTLSAFGFTVATQSDANVTAIKAKTDNLPAIPAPANEYDAELAAIQADLDNPNQYKADVSNLATTAHVQEVEDKVDAIKLKTDNIPATLQPLENIPLHLLQFRQM